MTYQSYNQFTSLAWNRDARRARVCVMLPPRIPPSTFPRVGRPARARTFPRGVGNLAHQPPMGAVQSSAIRVCGGDAY